MKLIIISVIFLTLAGCASNGGFGHDDPSYSNRNHVFNAPGYPIPRVERPKGFQFVDLATDVRREEGSRIGVDREKMKITETTISWVRLGADTALASVRQLAVDTVSSGGHWMPWKGSEGSIEIDGRIFQYALFQGAYGDVVFNNALLSEGSSRCGIAIMLQTDTGRGDKRTQLLYSEGVSCNEVNSFGGLERKKILERSIHVFGLR